VGTTLFYPRADFVNNTLDGQNKGRWGIRVLWAGDVLIANNIIMNFSATTPHLGVGIRGHCGHLTPDLHNNLFHNNSVDTKCTGSNYDPVFDDPLLDGNYRLTGKSPCIDAGFDGSALLQDDLDGDPRSRGTCGDGLYDIGWDEFAGCNDNGTCDPAENCEICPDECAGQKGGNQNDRYCCGNCINETPEGDGTICDGNF
jgi:hypothetical protein